MASCVKTLSVEYTPVYLRRSNVATESSSVVSTASRSLAKDRIVEGAALAGNGGRVRVTSLARLQAMCKDREVVAR